ncbi:diguanylate cyclase domain-containing protein [Paenibacillus koleovorans]|uniref:diguanylate cyclase domain-containing protein n=1 Tax=Paenibacillus koleovorans TaxID=121608 RepID=UPI0013E3F008|nr:diguanylate cyclase [Paenibacillus koleovorans]
MSKHVDVMTGLQNRKALELFLTERVEREEPVSLALLDVDHFMEINVQHGNEVGDKVLQVLAGLMQADASFHVFRVSGDEFAVALSDSSLEHAFLQMEKLRARVEGATEQFGLPEGQGVTITIGVAQYPRDAKKVEALNQAASAALMSAKEIGRNQVSLPPNEEMIMKSCYYPSTMTRKLKALAEQLKKKESALLREALEDLLRKYDRAAAK